MPYLHDASRRMARAIASLVTGPAGAARGRRCGRDLVMALTVGLVLTLALTLPAGRALAQTATSTLFIEVRDQSHALLPGVVVSLTNQENGIGRTGVTTPDGTLVVPLLPAATYTLTAALDGFKTEIVRDIQVRAATKGTLNLVLTPGTLTEQVVVSADLTTLRVGNSTVGEVFEDRTLVTLPVTERDALQFTFQSPGIAPPAPGSRLSTQGNIGLNSSGAREAANNFLLDGVDNNDLFLNRLVVNPSLDAIQEMSLLQNTYDAEYGRSSGAQVNVVLKSGTSNLHGSAYEFFRHSGLDARQVFEPTDTPKALLRKHQFGGTLGGPVGRLPSFYFVNVEGIRAREAETRLAHVPTAAERAGDFRDSGVTILDPFTGRPFANNTIPAGRLSDAGVNVASLYPTPNRADPDTNFVASPEGERNAVQFTIKTDHHWREDPFTLRYSFSRDNRDLPYPAHGRNLPGFGISVLDQGHNAAASFSQAIGSRMFNDLRVGLNALRRENLPQRSGIDGFAQLGIQGPSLASVDQAFPTFVLPGFESLGDDANLPVVRTTRTIHVSDSLSLELGRHHVKTGAELRHYQSDGFNHLFSRGEATFTGAFTGHPVADVLLGFPTFSLLATNDNRQALRTTAVNLFAQDDWRITPRLTVNAGVRYEYNAPPIDRDDRMRILDLDTFRLLQVGTEGVSRSGLQRDLNNVAPRVGASWDVTGQGTWLVRGGYGLFYDSGTLIENSALYFNPPYFELQLFFPSETAPIFLDRPFPMEGGFTPSPALNTLDPNFRTAYAHQASLAVERAFAGTTLAVRYVTTHGRNMVRKRNVNQPPPAPGDIDPRRPIQGFGDILLVESQASSSYHGLQVSAVRRYARPLSFRASYTWGRAMDDASAFLATDGDDNTPQDSRNLAAEWGPSDFDVRHRLVLTATYDVPVLFGSPIFRDWQVSAIFSAQSGRPFTPRVSFDNSNTGNIGGGTFAYDRPNVVAPSDVNTAVPPAAQAVTYDGRTFVIAPAFTFGNAGRNSLTGPAFASLDAVVARRVTLGAARSLELRLEIFNALNRANYQIPDSFVDRPTFGQSLSAFPPRQLQLAARFTF